MQQFIYHISGSSNVEYFPNVGIERNDNARFEVINGPISTVNNIFLLIKRYKLSAEFLKLIIKLITQRNALYAVIYDNKITSDGLLSFGQCNHYQVNKNDCIIGPVYTDNSYRGKGFGTYGLIMCIHHIRALNSHEKIYIDTREDNLAMSKVIQKAGFGDSKSSYQRIANQRL
jgi:RimJ/RimL family protein N-acetyltransferase